MEGWPDGPGVVTLPDGRRVRGRGLRNPFPASEPFPSFGYYLLARDPGPFEWPYRVVHWPDFRTPSDPAHAHDALVDAYARAATERVELACGGGIGRTGTAIAALAIIGGIAPDRAVAWARANYHPHAVETPWQRRWVARFRA